MTFNWLSAVVNVLPFVLSIVPGLPKELIPVIVHGIEEAEQMANKPGPDKKAHVMNLVRLAIDGVNAAKHRTVIDAAKVLPIIERAIDMGIAVINLMHRSQ